MHQLIEVPTSVKHVAWNAWQVQASSGVSRILPDGAMDLMFYCSASGARHAVVIGAMSQAELVETSPEDVLFGVRFRPGAAVEYLGESASTFRDREIMLDAVLGSRGERLATRVFEAHSIGARLRVVEEFLLDASSRRRPRHPKLLGLLRLLEQHQGNVGIDSMADAVGLGARHCERLFLEWVGVSPKRYARILRMQHAIELLTRGHTLAAVAAAAGYADQAHMTREFRELAGATPACLQREKTKESRVQVEDVGFVQSELGALG